METTIPHLRNQYLTEYIVNSGKSNKIKSYNRKHDVISHVCSVADVPGYTGVVPRADTCLSVEEVHLALLRGSLLCRKT